MDDHLSQPVAVTGASGFVGARLVDRLRSASVPVRAVVRATGAAARLRALGCQVALADVRDRPSLNDAFAGCRAVVHLVAIIRETSEGTFDTINRQGTANVAAAARDAGVGRVVHFSALGAAPAAPPYLRSKWAGEEEIRRAGIRHVIFRPSFVIGPGGGAAAQFADVIRFGPWYPFLLPLGWRRLFAWLAAAVPVAPVLGSGKYQSQPVAIDDVLAAVERALVRDDVLDQTFEVGGPDVMTYDEILDAVAQALGVRRWKVHLPLPLARLVVASFALMPNPPITGDEFAALLLDTVCDNTKIVQTFGLTLRPFREIIREVLGGVES